MKYKNDYNKLIGAIPMETLDPTTKTLLEDFGKYFKKYEEHDKIDFQVFLPSLERWHKHYKPDQLQMLISTMKNAVQDADQCSREGIIMDLSELALGTQVANIAFQYDQGELDMPLHNALSGAVDAHKMRIGAKISEWIDTPISELLKAEENDEGIRFRLKCLRESLRGLRGGDFILTAGRPDQGKTTFLSSEITYMAKQVPDERPILWFNNEGVGSRIVPRLYQSALGMTIEDVVQLSREGKLEQAYIDAVGSLHKIRVIDIHGWHIGQVEATIEHMKPSIAVFDMIDHIKGFGSEARTDLQLEEMYKYVRNICVKYDLVGIATSQISSEGDNMMYPPMSALKDSKTGKQGAVDAQIMIGSVQGAGLDNSRFISTPKNKLRRSNAPSNVQQETIFRPQIARYDDVKEGN